MTPSATISALALVAPLLAIGAAPPDTAPGAISADGGGAAPAPLVRESRIMHLWLHGKADRVFPLFGPVRETEWSPDWAPTFAWPAPAAQGPDGAVFTTAGQDGGEPSVWVMTDYDPGARRVRYVIVHPGLSVGELRIDVQPAGAGESTAEVTYRFTALTAAGNESIARWVAHFPHMAPHWEQALNGCLARGDGSR